MFSGRAIAFWARCPLLPVIVAAGLGGLRPGLLGTVLVSVAALVVVMSRPGASLSRGLDPVISYLLIGMLISWLFEGLHRARRRLEQRQCDLEQEIEQRHRAEQQVRQERERLQVTLASIGDAVIATDADGRVMFLNSVAEKLTGWPAAEAIGCLLSEVLILLEEETRQPVESPVSRVRQDGVVVGLPNRTVLKARDGTECSIAESAAPIRSEGGELIGTVLVFRDNTAARQAEISLHEADRQKNEFPAMLSHELRNPLAPIRTAAELLQTDSLDERTQRLVAETVQTQTEHLTRLVDDLLDVARIMSGKIALRRDLLELTATVRRAVETVRSEVDSRHHTLALNLPATPVWLQADPVRLNQILVNLPHNACKYTPERGRIEVSAECRNQDVRLSVRDNGLGIPPNCCRGCFSCSCRPNAVSIVRREGWESDSRCRTPWPSCTAAT